MAVQTKVLRPFLKWAGGKRQLLPQIRPFVPKSFETYFEPFLGAGAVFFDLRPERAVVNDLNTELINVYRVIQQDVDELLADLRRHRNDKDYYYQVRDMDRSDTFGQLTPVQRASRILFLNKTCYNGLFRVNRHNEFNVPFGRYKNPKIVNEAVLRAVHQYLQQHQIRIFNEDFEAVALKAQPQDFVYFDPPYDPVSDTASFTGYNINGFGRDTQVRLQRVMDTLTHRGCRVLLSNSATPFIQELYQGYTQVPIMAKRAINSNGQRRGRVQEMLILNYPAEGAGSGREST